MLCKLNKAVVDIEDGTQAKVIHIAGLAENLEDIIRRYRNIRVLSEESNVEHLDGLLRVAQRYPVRN